MSIGLPTLHLVFEDAAEALLTRAKKGVAGVMVRDAKAAGVYILTSSEDIPSSLSEANRAYVARAFLGSAMGKPTKVVLVAFADSAEGESGLATALILLQGKQVDYLAGPSDMTEEETKTVQDWAIAYRKNNPTLQAILPNCAADDRGVINYTSTVKVGSATIAPAQFCSRIAGAMAGLPTTCSATGVVLEEVTEVAPLNVEGKTEREAQNAAIAAGELILVHDGEKCQIARGVNSYVTLQPGEKESCKKIKVTEGEGLVAYYANKAIDEGYKGKMVNNYDNKCLLMVELREMFVKLENQGILLPGTSGAEIDVASQKKYLEDNGTDTSDMDEQAIKEADTGSWVFWRGYGRFADAMEDFEGVFVRGGTALEG